MNPDMASPEQKQETVDISSKSAVMWERFISAMKTAAGQMNAAISVAQGTVASAIIEAEGKSTKEWAFDMDNVRLVKLPQKE